MRAKREPYKYVDSFDKAAIRHKITQFYTLCKQLQTLNTLNSTLVGDPSFPGSVQTLRKRFSTADNQLNAKPRLSKDVRMQHFGFHKDDAINVNKVYLF